ncbi:hypothetical protein NECID01_1293 [Nematocida sp. AWRm77]|nr:hypothetical protein NECID01_1293 [Nematocida sp. AWRm77]
MAKRKAKRVKRKFVAPREEKRFSCLECHREHVVECRLDHSRGKGKAQCRSCDAVFVCSINKLSHSIDVYSEWVDSKSSGSKQKPLSD